MQAVQGHRHPVTCHRVRAISQSDQCSSEDMTLAATGRSASTFSRHQLGRWAGMCGHDGGRTGDTAVSGLRLAHRPSALPPPSQGQDAAGA
jgi:hypothetical protein